MASPQVLTPPETPANSDRSSKQRQKPRYKRIRFKPWKPEKARTQETAPDVLDKRQERQSPSTASSEHAREDQWSTSDLDSIIRSATCRPSPLQILPVNGTRRDPFTQLPIKAEGIVPATLDYFLGICAPNPDPGYTVEGHKNPHLSMLFPFMLQNALLFESIIALCRASILICVGQPAADDRPLIYHRTRAIKGVSAALGTADATNDATLLSIAMLLTLEYLVGNVAAVSAHRAGLEKMVAMRTDFDDGDPWKRFVKAGLEAYKSLGSFVTGEAPEVSNDSHAFIQEAFAELSLDRPIIYPSLPFSPDLCTILSRLPSGFSELCLSGNLSTQTMQVLASLAATTRFCEFEGFDGTKLNAELQAMLSALQRLSLMRISSNEKYLTCGLVAYAFHLRRLRALNLFHDPTLRTFIKLIPNQEKVDSVREQRCMIWISMAVAGALHLRTIRMPGAHLVLDKIFQLYPVTRCWEPMEEILKSFFWTPSILEHWRKCHKDGMYRWKQISKATQEMPLVDLEGFSETMDKPGEIEQLDFEQLRLHARGAPGEMIDMMKAAQCPFQGRTKTTLPPHPLVNPHS